jgi:hypothetical protein
MGPLLDNANSEDCLLRRTMVLLDLAVYYRGLQRACCLHQGCHILYYTARISISLKDYLRCKLKVSVLLFFLSFLQLKKKTYGTMAHMVSVYLQHHLYIYVI